MSAEPAIPGDRADRVQTEAKRVAARIAAWRKRKWAEAEADEWMRSAEVERPVTDTPNWCVSSSRPFCCDVWMRRLRQVGGDEFCPIYEFECSKGADCTAYADQRRRTDTLTPEDHA